MKKLVLLVSLVTVAALTTYSQAIKKCDVTVLIATSEKTGHLTQNEIRDFLLTLGKDCKNNAEFSEWSNELLFETIDSQTELTLKTIERDEKKLEMNEILTDLSSPINDRTDIKKLLIKVEKVKIDIRLKQQIVEKLKLAAEHSN